MFGKLFSHPKARLSGAFILVLLIITARGQTPSPGKPATNGQPSALLSPEHQKLFDAGKDLYEVTCLACHQLNGLGQEALAPRLVNSPWVTNSPERLVRIVLHGMRGPLKINDRTLEFPAEMPPLGVLDDDQIASVLTYVRRSWGHSAGPITPQVVKKIRDATSERAEAWTEAELLKIP